MVIVITNNRLLGQRIRFELTFAGVSSLILSGHDAFDFSSVTQEDTLLLDVSSDISAARYAASFCRFSGVFLLSEKEENVKGCKTLRLPLPIGALKGVLEKKEAVLLFPEGENGSYVLLDGEKVVLSKTEYALLKTLYDAGGAYVGRDTLLCSIFGDEVSQSALNVYIHYLRKKLEKGERRLILSSRTGGYALKL